MATHTRQARPVPPSRLRRLALGRQGLTGKRRLGTGREGVAKALARLGCVQIDTISVVARAHDHILFNRVARYDASMLGTLVAQRRVFEYWSHAAAYLPIGDFRFALPMMRAVGRGEVLRGSRRDAKVRRRVLDRIRAEGPLYARDFEQPKARGSGWWDWKPAKLALEQLFLEGVLTVVERQGFQKRFELTERFLPAHIDTAEPGPEEHADHVIDRALAAHGFASARTAAFERRDARVRSVVRRRLSERARAGELALRRGAGGEAIYAVPGALDRAPAKPPDAVRILSPFDNAVIQRRRGIEVFGFDYTIECYLPPAKRRYGYFALPLAFGERLVGRMDCKSHRGEGRFEIRALYLEADVPDAFWPAFRAAVTEFARFDRCGAVEVDKVRPASLAPVVRALFA